MNLTISLRRTSSVGGLWYVNHDLVPRGGANGFPETNRCLTDKMFPVSAQLLALVRAVLRLMHPELTDAEFDHELQALYRNNAGFSNQNGIESGHFKIENLYCGGATLRAVTGQPVKAAGTTWLEVYALDPAHLPPPPKTLAAVDMTQWFFPTTALPDASNPFPNFGGRCLIPFLGENGRNFVNWNNLDRADKSGVVQVGHILNPFLPARWDLTSGLIDPYVEQQDDARLIHDFQVPAQGTFLQLKHDFELAEHEYMPRSITFNEGSPNSELPETVHLDAFDSEDFVSLTEEMQWFHFALIRKARPDLSTEELKNRWRALTVNSVAFTDKHSIDYGTRFFGGDPSKNFADYILGENLDNPKPIAWKAISTGGNLVKIIQDTTIEAIDFTRPLPNIDEVWSKPWLIHWATAETITALPTKAVIDGALRNTWQVCRFPQLAPAGTPFPIWGRGGKNRITDPKVLKPLGNGSTFSPYVP